MKIGILTLPLHTNYGGILQAYALQTVLERMGHEVSLISIKAKRKSGMIGILRYWILSPIKQFFIRNFVPAQYSGNRGYYTSKFIKKWIHRDFFTSYYNISQEKYDAIVVGSDQIWRKQYVCESNKLPIESSFLDFAMHWDIKRISYAASFGTEEWEYNDEQTKHCRELIKLFDYVSVREKSGVALCKDYLQHNAKVVLDPTFLLKKNDYLKLLNKNINIKGRYLMTYILDENEINSKIINIIVEKLCLNIYQANVPGIDSKDDVKKRTVQPPLENWLAGFANSEFVVTDSFHACVFSIIFNKPFVVIPNIARGSSRFDTLLETFNQKFRLINSIEKFKLCNEILEKPNCLENSDKIKESYSFLINSLK